MATYSTSFRSAVRGMFPGKYTDYINQMSYNDLSDINSFGIFDLKWEGDTIFIPTGYSVGSSLSETSDYVFPVGRCDDNEIRKFVTAESMFKDAMDYFDVENVYKLIKYQVGDNFYYGRKGLLLSERKNIFFVAGARFHKDYVDPIGYEFIVNAECLFHQDNPISKMLLKRVIPYLKTEGTSIHYYPKRTFINVKVLVDDITKKMVKPEIPSNPLKAVEGAGKFLLDNFDSWSKQVFV